MTRAGLLILLLLAPMGACSCDEDAIVPVGPGRCEPDYVCEQGFTYRLGECRVARCASDEDCCPGQRCSAGAGLCVDPWVACVDDGECEAGRRCLDFRGGRYCAFPNASGETNPLGTQSCASTADCPPRATCLGTRCVVEAPCEGGCPDGQICDVDSDRCFAFPCPPCDAGQIAVVADPDTMSSAACCAVECACATLPPLPEGQLGWHASLAASPDRAFVAAYDATYGDLVVAELDAEGRRLSVASVDGFPADGPVVADPAGRRGGRRAPGPDVGEYASLARGPDGALHVGYYDRTEGRLKYARRDPAGAWLSYPIDDDGDVGRFTTLALDRAGVPHVAYMVVQTASGDRTGLRFAAASGPTPSSGREWRIQDVELVDRPRPPCGGRCPIGQVCAELGPEPACAREATDCPVACGDAQACVEGPAGPECAGVVDVLELDDLPLGTGLFASLSIDRDGRVRIAYHDRIAGALRLAEALEGPDAGFELRTLDGGEGRDVGAHASLAHRPDGRWGVAYVDRGRDDLLYLDADAEGPELVDDGATAPDLRLVGADAALVFDPAGQPAIAYQDATRLDLRYARRRPDGSWGKDLLRGDGAARDDGLAAGFYATQAVVDDRAWVGSVTVGFDADRNLQLFLTVDVLPL